jgi:Protein of unknown function (DUF2630)
MHRQASGAADARHFRERDRSEEAMDDSDVQNHIEALVAEEHRLYAAAEREGGESQEERRRLEEVRVQLDRYWDLLRRRRAQEEFGLDPNGEQLRPASTVERYQQ